MDAARPAFVEIDSALRRGRGADHVLVDMHAEATSEKVAMGWDLDGRVTAVVGTHTHVPTNDARVLPGGTAYITDVGMTGARGGVIGVKKEDSIEHLRTRMPVRYETATDDPWLKAVLVRCARPGRAAASIEPVLRPDVVGPQQREQRDRQEPDEVEVEPVTGGQLDREQQRGGEREASVALHAAASHGERPTTAACGGELEAREVVEAPDRERRVALGLEADRRGPRSRRGRRR